MLRFNNIRVLARELMWLEESHAKKATLIGAVRDAFLRLCQQEAKWRLPANAADDEVDEQAKWIEQEANAWAVRQGKVCA